MDIVIFGATGMVGQGVVRECLADAGVTRIVTIGRSPLGIEDPRIAEILRPDLFALDDTLAALSPLDACFYCLGTSAVGKSEEDYTRQTHDLALAIARPLAAHHPGLTFVYVSGTGTDATEAGRTMWARVKGRTENALAALPFKAAYMFRPGVIVPRDGIVSKTGWYRALYAVMAPIAPTLERMFPRTITSTDRVGRAMIAVVRAGYPRRVLENADINVAAG